MTPEQRLVVLETLLEKVRRTANERGLDLPSDLPRGAFKNRQPRKALTAFTETGGGNHAPLALVQAPLEPAYVGSSAAHEVEPEPPPPPALVGFAPTFEDEITSDANPEAIEAQILEQMEQEARAATNEPAIALDVPAPAMSIVDVEEEPAISMPIPLVSQISPPPQVEPLQRQSALPPGMPLSTSPGRLMTSLPSVRPSSVPRPSHPPIELDDLDDLDVPAAPRISEVPKAPLAPSMLERAFSNGEAAAAPRRSAPPPAPVAPTPVPPTPAPPPIVAAPQLEAMLPTPVVEVDDVSAAVAASSELQVEPAPESQRQKVYEERPVDDALEGISEPPPESGEVESQRSVSRSRESMESRPEDDVVDADELGAVDVVDADDLDVLEVSATRDFDEHALLEDEDGPVTPRPTPDVTAEVRSLGDVDVVERPSPPKVEVAVFRGTSKRAALSFGELLDRALELASRASD